MLITRKIREYTPYLEADLEKFKARFEEYLTECIEVDKPLNVPAMCVKLGIATRTLKNMETWDMYRDEILYMKTIVEADLSSRGLEGKAESSAINLQLKHNHNYIEKTEQNVNVKTLNLVSMSLEEMEAKIKENELLEMKLKAKLLIPKGE